MDDNRILDNLEGLYPWIKSISHDSPMPAEIIFNKGSAPIYQEWLENLRIFYAIDQGNQVSLLFDHEIPDGYSINDIHRIAVENLARDVEYGLGRLNFDGGFGLMAGGDYEASSITLNNLWDSIADELQDDLLVGIPTKDLVMFCRYSDSDAISNLKETINEAFDTGENKLTKSIFRYHIQDGIWLVH